MKLLNGVVKTFCNESYGKKLLNWYIDTLPSDLFKDEEYVMYKFLVYCKDISISPTLNYFKGFMNLELLSLTSKYGLTIKGTKYTPQDISTNPEVIINTLSSLYTEYLNFSELSIDEFKLYMTNMFKQLQAYLYQTIINQQMMSMNSNTSSPETAITETIARLTNIDSVINNEQLKEIDIYVNRTSEHKSNIMRKICDFPLGIMKNDYAMYSKSISTLVASPGVGKTRFLIANFVYPVMMQGKSVLFIELELSETEVKNMLIAHHIAQRYKYSIPDSVINRGELPENVAPIVEAASMDLFEGPYGRFHFIDGTLGSEITVENLYAKCSGICTSNKDIELIALDYLGLIGSAKNLSTADSIDKSLIALKKLAKKLDIHVACVCQYNNEGNQVALAGGTIQVGHVQGGQAVHRHVDYHIDITQTLEQKALNLIILSTSKNRASKGYRNKPIKCSLGVSMFFDYVEKSGK